MSSVISLLMDAGGVDVSASFAHRTCPVSPSMMMACSADVAMSACAGTTAQSAAKAANTGTRLRKRRMQRLLIEILLVDDDLSVGGARFHRIGKRRIGLAHI